MTCELGYFLANRISLIKIINIYGCQSAAVTWPLLYYRTDIRCLLSSPSSPSSRSWGNEHLTQHLVMLADGMEGGWRRKRVGTGTETPQCILVTRKKHEKSRYGLRGKDNYSGILPQKIILPPLYILHLYELRVEQRDSDVDKYKHI